MSTRYMYYVARVNVVNAQAHFPTLHHNELY